MNKDVGKKWLEALLSGEYAQGTGSLHTVLEEYCCLGVLCDLAFKEGIVGRNLAERPDAESGEVGRYEYGGNPGYLPHPVMKWAGLKESSPTVLFEEEVWTLAGLNDASTDFSTVALVIKEQLVDVA